MPRSNDRDVAYAAMLSGDDTTGRFGGALLTDRQRREILDQRKAEFKHQQEKGQGLISLGNGFLHDPNTGETFRDPKLEAYDAREHQRQLERIDAQMSRSQGKLTAGERQKITEDDNKIRQGAELIQGLQENPDTIEPWADSFGDLIGKVSIPAKQMYEASHKTDEEQSLRGKIARYESDIRKDELGSALTGFELEKAAEWSPSAPGITVEEAIRRLTNLHNAYVAQYETYLRTGGYAPPPQQEQTAPRHSQAAPKAQPQEVWELNEKGEPVRVQ